MFNDHDEMILHKGSRILNIRLFFFLCIQFVNTMSIQGTRPALSLFADSQGASPLVIGLLVASVSTLPILTAISIGKWVDRYGAFKLAVSGGILMITAIGVPALFGEIWALFVSQIFLGIGQILFGLSFQKTTANLPGDRDKIISTTTFVGAAAAFLGPLVGGYIYQFMGMQFLFGIFAISLFINFSFIFFSGAEKWKRKSKDVQLETEADINIESEHDVKKEVYSAEEMQTRSVFTLLKDKELLKAIAIGGLFNKGTFISFFPVYATQIGMDAGTIGLVLSIFNGAGMLARIFQYWLVQKMGHERVIFFIFLTGAIFYAFVPFTTVGAIHIILAIFIGGSLGLGHPISLVYSFNLCPKQRQGEMLGLRVSFNRSVGVTTPIVLGALATFAGLSIMFLGTSVVLLLGAYLTRPLRKAGSIDGNNTIAK